MLYLCSVKLKCVEIIMALAACTGCAALSPADEAVERISACVATQQLDSLDALVPGLRLAVTDGSHVIERAANISPEVFGAALAVAKPPRESAMIFVNMLAAADSSRRSDAAKIARQAISCYMALNRNDECDSFIAAVDEEALRLPVGTQAAILAGSVDPRRLGLSLKQHRDTSLINAVRSAYGADTQRLNQFNNALK